jgi:hypothetical protein
VDDADDLQFFNFVLILVFSFSSFRSGIQRSLRPYADTPIRFRPLLAGSYRHVPGDDP